MLRQTVSSAALRYGAVLAPLILLSLGSSRPAHAQSENVLSANSSIHVVTADEKEETGDYTVDPRGNIAMQYAGQVHVGGLTPPQAQVRIARALGKYFVQPKVIVTLISAGNYRITGAVRQPAEYPLTSPNFTLADAIGRAGGIADRAHMRETTIIRRAPDGRSYVIKLNASNASVQASTLIQRDDDITIPVGSPQMNPLSVLGTALGLGGLFRH